jgi:hypothetical protein
VVVIGECIADPSHRVVGCERDVVGEPADRADRELKQARPTAEGLAAGDPASRLFELYDRTSLTEVPASAPSEQDVTQYEITNGSQPLVVVVEGSPESGRVAAISAGSLCPTAG